MPAGLITVISLAAKYLGKRGQKATPQQKGWRCLVCLLVAALIATLLTWISPELGKSFFSIFLALVSF